MQWVIFIIKGSCGSFFALQDFMLPRLYYVIVVIVVCAIGALGLLNYHKYGTYDRNIYREFPFQPEPLISARIIPKYPEGFRLRVRVYNFELSEICTFEEVKKATGHMHIYVNDVFYTMMFHEEMEPDLTHLLQPGDNKITIMLTSPDHKYYTVNKKPLSETLYFDPLLEKDKIEEAKEEFLRPKAINKIESLTY